MKMDSYSSSISVLATVIVFFVTTILLRLWWKSRRAYTHWSSKGVKGPKPKVLFGNFLDFALNSQPELFPKWYKQFGPVYGLYEGTRPILMVQDADLIKELFIKNSHIFLDRREIPTVDEYSLSNLFAKRGDEWRVHRRIMSPTFTSGKMKAMLPLMQQCYDKLDAELSRIVDRGEEVNSKFLFSKLTSSVIARCAFATEVDPYAEENNALLNALHSMFKVNRTSAILFNLLPRPLRKYVRPSGDPQGRLYVRKVCMEIVRERKEMNESSKGSTKQYSDLLQLLLDAGNEEKSAPPGSVSDHESHHVIEEQSNGHVNPKSEAKKSFTDIELVANVVMFFAAGFETTSTLLQYCSYVLTNEQHVQEELYQQLKKTYDENDGKFDYDTLASHQYLDSFICETLRMYPPAGRVERMASAPYTLPNGIKVDPGTLVAASMYTMHRDPKYFEKPDTFDLHRFLPENRGKIVPCSYVPFGLGPRNCIGMRFSLLEAKLALAKLLIKYKFVASPRATKQLQFKPMAIVLTPKELLVKIERRQ